MEANGLERMADNKGTVLLIGSETLSSNPPSLLLVSLTIGRDIIILQLFNQSLSGVKTINAHYEGSLLLLILTCGCLHWNDTILYTCGSPLSLFLTAPSSVSIHCYPPLLKSPPPLLPPPPPLNHSVHFKKCFQGMLYSILYNY
jgi:hypothetical protein